MLRSMFGKKKGKSTEHTKVADTLWDARCGDVFTISGVSVVYDEAYFIVEKRNRYENYAGDSYELLGVDGDTRLWVEWSGPRNNVVMAARLDDRPISIDRLGLTENDVARMDEEYSLDNRFEYEGALYHYLNSGEAFLYQDGSEDGEGFYLWEFADDDNEKFISIAKWEGVPFQAYLSEAVSQDSVVVYRQ